MASSRLSDLSLAIQRLQTSLRACNRKPHLHCRRIFRTRTPQPEVRIGIHNLVAADGLFATRTP
jgi:hypothetical protein